VAERSGGPGFERIKLGFVCFYFAVRCQLRAYASNFCYKIPAWVSFPNSEPIVIFKPVLK